jgi:hypothetical protein
LALETKPERTSELGELLRHLSVRLQGVKGLSGQRGERPIDSVDEGLANGDELDDDGTQSPTHFGRATGVAQEAERGCQVLQRQFGYCWQPRFQVRCGDGERGRRRVATIARDSPL